MIKGFFNYGNGHFWATFADVMGKSYPFLSGNQKVGVGNPGWKATFTSQREEEERRKENL